MLTKTKSAQIRRRRMQNESDCNEEVLIQAYNTNLEIWKKQTDVYFQRVQILMMGIQAALFVGFLATLSKPPIEEYQLLIATGVAVIGIFISITWNRLIRKEHHFLEFCRRSLRAIEFKLAQKGIPLQYFVLESHIFGKPSPHVDRYPGGATLLEEDKGVVYFGNERYPEPNCAIHSAHKLNEVRGGLMKIDMGIALGASLVWFVAFASLATILVLKHLNCIAEILCT